MGDIKTERVFEYDERRKILKVINKNKSDELTSEYIDNFNEKGIKSLYGRFNGEKKRIEKAIEQTKTLKEKNQEQIDSQLKILPKLSEDQKKLIEDLKVVQQHEKIENLKTQIESQEENLKNLAKNLKEKNVILNEIKSKVKFKLE